MTWLNSPPLTRAALKGKVVVVDFWTYSCINCLRSLPYIRAWAGKYKDHGLVVIGVHAPEFAFEKDLANVKNAVANLGVTYPVAVDSNLAIWQAFNNEYWPAHYFIDGQGRIRAHHFGEGDYDQSERVIQTLLKEAGYRNVPDGIVNPSATGQFAQADDNDMESPETYLGYGRGRNFAFGPPHINKLASYKTPDPLQPNQWGFAGPWTIGEGEERSPALRVPKISFRTSMPATCHLVLGPASGGKPVPASKVMLDNQPPGGDAHGSDTDAAGAGTVCTGQRLYPVDPPARPGLHGSHFQHRIS